MFRVSYIFRDLKNRRMNPPRPALSCHGTVTSEPAGRIGLQRTFHRPQASLPILRFSSFQERLFLDGDGKEGCEYWKNALWSGPSTRYDWPADGQIPLTPPVRRHALACGRLTKHAFKTPRKSVSGRGGNRHQDRRSDSRLFHPL